MLLIFRCLQMVRIILDVLFRLTYKVATLSSIYWADFSKVRRWNYLVERLVQKRGPCIGWPDWLGRIHQLVVMVGDGEPQLVAVSAAWFI